MMLVGGFSSGLARKRFMNRRTQQRIAEKILCELEEMRKSIDAVSQSLRAFLGSVADEISTADNSRVSNARTLDRYKWGQAVAKSLAPKFDSYEFARGFRSPLPPAVAVRFDAVRLKKILLRLCREKVITMAARGAGRRAAQYQVITKTSN